MQSRSQFKQLNFVLPTHPSHTFSVYKLLVLYHRQDRIFRNLVVVDHRICAFLLLFHFHMSCCTWPMMTSGPSVHPRALQEEVI